ncbi:hypothetical protein Ahy_B05g076733 isoform B [Arachis hypogaea]|uniref:Uncharacterized protein n=1 Tax=Arachis hypogaea TaxID=3818 RepID=A0A444Z3W9_ARAHY|nr:hypothetical protein Ahy_B05g076733 isoform B [Arachis hypogaea]
MCVNIVNYFMAVPIAVIFCSKSVYVAKDEILHFTERKTIKKLRDAAGVGFYVVLTTILAVDLAPHWWCKSCVCNIKAEANGDT